MDSGNTAITGAGGYVGRRLMDELDADGYDLYHVADDVDGCQPLDARDEKAISRLCDEYDCLIHLAAVSGVGDCADSPEEAIRNNVETLSTVARYCAKTETHLIFPSSQAIGAESIYGETKRLCESILEALPGLTYTTLEFSNIYGSYTYRGENVTKTTVIDAFLEMANGGGPLTVHKPGTQRRNFVHIDDVARAYALATNTTGRYVVTGPDTLSILDLAERIASKFGVECECVEPDRPPANVKTPGEEADLPGFVPTRTVDEYISGSVTDKTYRTPQHLWG